MSQAILASPLGALAINVYDYKLGLSSQLDSAQVRDGMMWYPIKALQDDFIFYVQFNSVDSMVKMQNFLLSHYKNKDLTLAQQCIIRFYWPEMQFDYAGIIKNFSMGVKKFEYAPKRMYTMQLVRDNIYTVTGGFSSTTSWQDIYGTSVVDTNPPNTTPGDGTDPGDLAFTPPNPNGPLNPPHVQ